MRSPPRRKRFGQHFLHDGAILERIAAAVGPRAGDRMVEIGPGKGALTRRLLSGAASLDAVEIDRDLTALLRSEFADRPLFTLHEADALKFDFTALAQARGGKLRIVGNLPYNISTPLLFHLLDHRAVIEDLHIMLQREVVARMAASPGNGDYGRLTLMLAPWVSIERLFDIGPGAFQPAPRVWSSVARLTVRPEPAFEVAEHYRAVVAAAFAHRRKTLRNALRELVSEDQIRASGVDPDARPGTLAPDGFNTIARKIVRSPSSA